MDEQLQKAGQVRTEAEAALLEVQEQIAQATALIDAGKSEVIEILNQRASTKGQLQRYDTMTEQIQIRRAELNQRLLRNRSHKTEQDSLIHSFQEELDLSLIHISCPILPWLVYLTPHSIRPCRKKLSCMDFRTNIIKNIKSEDTVSTEPPIAMYPNGLLKSWGNLMTA